MPTMTAMAAKTSLGIAVAGLFLGLLAACSRQFQPLHVGVNNWPGYAPLYLAAVQGHYNEREVRIHGFPNTVEVMRSYRNRTIDVAAVTSDEALLLAQQDKETRIILICDYSTGADMILARPEIGRLTDLRGKRVGVEPGALGAFLLTRALTSVGLTPADVTVVPSQYQSLSSDYRQERVDAVVTYEPVASEVLAMGAHRLFDSRAIPGEVADVLVVRQSLIDERMDSLVHLLEGWFGALADLQARPAEADAVLTRSARLPAGTFPAIFESIHFANLAENRRMLAGSPGIYAQNLERLGAFLFQQRLLQQPPDISNLISRSALELTEKRVAAKLP